MIKNIINYLTYMPKQFIAYASILALVLAPMQGIASEPVEIEASIQVANVTQSSDDTYFNQVDAQVDEVVQFQIFYHNMEHEDSGNNANNLSVKVDLPNSAGKTQTVTATIKADNSNTVVDTAVVNQTLDRAYLEFIPGTVKWRHNSGTNDNQNWVTDSLPDSVVTGSGFTTIEDAQPCDNFAATITFQARVKAPVVSITKQVRVEGETEWKTKNTAQPGDVLEYLITVKNEGNVTLNNLVIGDNLPARVTYIADTTKLANASFPQGTSISSNNVTAGGIDIGNYSPGANAFTTFKAKIDENLAPGNWEFSNVAIVDADEVNPVENFAITKVFVPGEEPEQPEQPESPDMPDELPVTGIGGIFGGILGSGALGIGARSWYGSRRKLIDSLSQ